MIKRKNYLVSLTLNLIVLISVFLVVLYASFFGEDLADGLSINGIHCFKFFTVDSNILAAISCLFVAIDCIKKRKSSKIVSLFKFVGTAAVSLTFLTVMIFLGPTMGYAKMLEGGNLFLHLICPVLCIISLLFFDDMQKISFKESLLGMLPMIVYGIVYFLMVMIFKIWLDFYGFNTNGGWILSVILMLFGTFLICFVLWKILNSKSHK